MCVLPQLMLLWLLLLLSHKCNTLLSTLPRPAEVSEHAQNAMCVSLLV